jgi:tRNA threonylcarbamoyladenosine biosynthesis protein TsaB
MEINLNILAINTTSSSGSIAISQDNIITFVSYLNIQKTHSERVMPQIDFGLKQCNLTVSDLDLICFAIGPGSFTGLRIGLATAKGLSYACQIPIMPINSLEALAYNLYGSNLPIVCIMDAKMGEIYGAIYSSKLEVIISPENSLPELFLKKIVEPAIIIGDGIIKYEKLIRENVRNITFGCMHQNVLLASNLLSVAAFKPIPKYDFNEVSNLEPQYLRKSQAELIKEAKMGETNGTN